ncbi:hypothetical protein IQ24_03558 [Paracoccus sulfuroxidans]|uniref:Uncharacterized protein n=1 Tax=Paracoccus sulfuroxidans TaxID=384678 RepID=A0A562NCV1_9RHOB|nr:hypothetical protein IQ24_03558 [Paracoccus sulfuroxidans]
MGFDPEQVGRMSRWQFMACLDGYARANGAGPSQNAPRKMSIERMRELGIEVE